MPVLSGPGAHAVRSPGRINVVLTGARGFLAFAVDQGEAPDHVLHQIYELADSRHLPVAAPPGRPTAPAAGSGSKALNEAVAAGEEISVSAIARRAGVNRSFLYNHRDLHATILAKAAEPPTTPTGGPAVSRTSLVADLGNAHDRITRLTAENQHLRNRLSEALGEQVWKETGLGGPTNIQQLQRRITELEQHTVELRRQLSDRDTELDAARAANRDLMSRLNKTTTSRQEQP